jgi:hypothetical protein
MICSTEIPKSLILIFASSGLAKIFAPSPPNMHGRPTASIAALCFSIASPLRMQSKNHAGLRLNSRTTTLNILSRNGYGPDTYTQTHRHTDTQTHKHTDTQTHRHTDTQTHTGGVGFDPDGGSAKRIPIVVSHCLNV